VEEYGVVQEKYYVDATTAFEVLPDDIILQVTDVRNPRSVEPTENFVLTTYDAATDPVGGYTIANGTGGNVFMATGGTFSDLALSADDGQNGATADYEVAWTAGVPIRNEDVFFMHFPEEMEIPSKPECELISDPPTPCPKAIVCQAEKGSVVATLYFEDGPTKRANDGPEPDALCEGRDEGLPGRLELFRYRDCHEHRVWHSDE
jgi:hypothetical protein